LIRELIRKSCIPSRCEPLNEAYEITTNVKDFKTKYTTQAPS